MDATRREAVTMTMLRSRVIAAGALGMPGDLGRTWSLHLQGAGGALLLGATVPRGPRVAATIALPSLGTVGVNRFWNDTVHLCVAVGPIASCAPAVFDSGTFSMQLWGDGFAAAPTYPSASRVVAGTPVTVAWLPTSERPAVVSS